MTLLFLCMTLIREEMANGETPNFANPTKPGTEAIVAGLEGCQAGFEKGRRAQNRWHGSKQDKLLSFYFCGCQFDAMRKYPNDSNQQHAQTCIDEASDRVLKSASGLLFRVNNIFDPNAYAYSAIQGAFYTCEAAEEQSKTHKWPKKYGQRSRYCSCVIDFLQDRKTLDLTLYAEDKYQIDSKTELLCQTNAKRVD